MRTEYKVGLVVGMVVIVCAVVYFALQNNDGTDDVSQTGSPSPEDTSQPPNRLQEDAPASPAEDTVLMEPGDTVTPQLTVREPDAEPEDSESDLPSILPLEGTAQEPIETPPSSATIDRQDDGTPRQEYHSPWVVDEATVPESLTSARQEKTYTVKTGDTLWLIAKKEYGSGKYWYLLHEANAEARKKFLQPGQVLKIPPLPVEKLRTTPAVHVPTSGTYTIKPSDNKGFWGISENLYGSGKYATAIEKANPGVDSKSLKPGQKIKLPEKSVIDRLKLAPSARPKRGADSNTPPADGKPLFLDAP